MKAIFTLTLFAILASAKLHFKRDSKPKPYRAVRNDGLKLQENDILVAGQVCEKPFTKAGFETLGDVSANRNKYPRAAIKFLTRPSDDHPAGESFLKGDGCGGCFKITNVKTREYIKVLNVNEPDGDTEVELGQKAFKELSGVPGKELEVEVEQLGASSCGAAKKPKKPKSDSESAN